MSNGTVEAPRIEDLIPLFSNYNIEKLIAVGGMGAVYKGVQTSLDRTVAIKILPKQFGQNPEFCAQFQTEAKVMARVNHPNLLGVLDFGNVGGLLYIVMEYAGKGSVHDATYRSGLEEEDKIDLIIQASMGIAHAHEMGMIHRDIKPANLLIDDNNTVKVADFGLAIEQGYDSGDEEIWGTPGFTAPEVFTGPNQATVKSDIFSLGGSLYYLLFKKDPDKDGVKITQLKDLDEDLSAIIVKCMASDPSRRYDNASLLAEDLIAYKESLNPNSVGNKAKAPPALKVGNSALLITGSPSAATQNNSGVQAPNIPVKLKSSSNGSSIFILVAIIALIVGGVFFFVTNKGSATKPTPSSEATDSTEATDNMKVVEVESVKLKNGSFEEFEKTEGNENLDIFKDWKFYLFNKNSVVRRAKAKGLNGSTAALLKSSSVEQVTDIYIQKGMVYQLNILLGKRTNKEINPKEDFEVQFLIGDHLLKSIGVFDLKDVQIKEREMTSYIFDFFAKSHLSQFENGPLKIKIISKKAIILVDNLSIQVRPIKPEEY